MPYICPLCNAMEIEQPVCPTCLHEMEDEGRFMDFFDDYSPYLAIDGMKISDGIPNDLQNHLCPHLFVCRRCGDQIIKTIAEVHFQ